MQKSSQKAQGYSQTIVPMVVSLSYINYAIVSVVGGYMCLQQTMDVGSLASYLVFVRQAAMPINQFTMQLNLLLTSLSGAERIFELMDMDPEVDEGRVTLVNVRKENDQYIETKENTGLWAWRHPRENGIEYVELKGDVRFIMLILAIPQRKRSFMISIYLPNRDRRLPLLVPQELENNDYEFDQPFL